MALKYVIFLRITLPSRIYDVVMYRIFESMHDPNCSTGWSSIDSIIHSGQNTEIIVGDCDVWLLVINY
jgi:hypothetical protein